MKWLSTVIVMTLLLAFGPVNRAESYTSFGFSVGFHDELAPYGRWVSVSSYGHCWEPYVSAGWRPYVNGYWASSSYGPTWYGSEVWSPYVYHYGYWIWSAQFGWVWVPGNEWHAGRVQWSYGGGYIGWRPLFPSGYHYGGSDINFWTFIDADRFGYRNYSPYVLRSAVVRDLFDRRIVRRRAGTLRTAELEQIVRRPIRRVQLVERDVQIGSRRAKMRVTNEEEARVRQHVTRIQKKSHSGVQLKSEPVLKGKFDEISKKSLSSRKLDGRTDVQKSFQTLKSKPSKTLESKSHKVQSPSTKKGSAVSSMKDKKSYTKSTYSSHKPDKKVYSSKKNDFTGKKYGTSSTYSSAKKTEKKSTTKHSVYSPRTKKESTGMKSSSHSGHKSYTGRKEYSGKTFSSKSKGSSKSFTTKKSSQKDSKKPSKSKERPKH